MNKSPLGRRRRKKNIKEIDNNIKINVVVKEVNKSKTWNIISTIAQIVIALIGVSIAYDEYIRTPNLYLDFETYTYAREKFEDNNENDNNDNLYYDNLYYNHKNKELTTYKTKSMFDFNNEYSNLTTEKTDTLNIYTLGVPIMYEFTEDSISMSEDRYLNWAYSDIYFNLRNEKKLNTIIAKDVSIDIRFYGMSIDPNSDLVKEIDNQKYYDDNWLIKSNNNIVWNLPSGETIIPRKYNETTIDENYRDTGRFYNDEMGNYYNIKIPNIKNIKTNRYYYDKRISLDINGLISGRVHKDIIEEGQKFNPRIEVNLIYDGNRYKSYFINLDYSNIMDKIKAPHTSIFEDDFFEYNEWDKDEYDDKIGYQYVFNNMLIKNPIIDTEHNPFNEVFTEYLNFENDFSSKIGFIEDEKDTEYVKGFEQYKKDAKYRFEKIKKRLLLESVLLDIVSDFSKLEVDKIPKGESKIDYIYELGVKKMQKKEFSEENIEIISNMMNIDEFKSAYREYHLEKNKNIK